ncbi:unnamed protein product [Soboliphyme baturini]|uniref:Uncharacterized protein n=1 Tax=Soboliphyme baturini TaxID=241478 RepID=A0A183IW74_9BILA|nr:unnamed protein product [Soboliphyme baturini]
MMLKAQNYRTIPLISQIYKVFTRIIVSRTRKSLEMLASKEQAGFRKEFSTMGHVHIVRQKTFASVELNATLNDLRDCSFNPVYIDLIQDLNTNTAADIKLSEEPLSDWAYYWIQNGAGRRRSPVATGSTHRRCCEMFLIRARDATVVVNYDFFKSAFESE